MKFLDLSTLHAFIFWGPVFNQKSWLKKSSVVHVSRSARKGIKLKQVADVHQVIRQNEVGM